MINIGTIPPPDETLASSVDERRVKAESILPKEIIWRKKAGFSAPIRSWLCTSLKPMINDLLSEQTIKRRGLFDYKEVKRIINANDSGREDFNLQVFQLLNLEIWMREFLD